MLFQLVEALEWWGPRSELITRLHVQPIITARCVSEQAEPLFLLPDYVAGMYHHADPRTVLGKPVADSRDASELVHAFRRRHRKWLYEQPEDFDRQYPLDHEGGLVVLREPKPPA